MDGLGNIGSMQIIMIWIQKFLIAELDLIQKALQTIDWYLLKSLLINEHIINDYKINKIP